MGRQPRQRPISCKLCRQRKLRCSRQFPCSNCTTRGVVCQHDGPETAPAPRASVDPGELTATADTKEVPNAELLARLEKLEALIAAQTRDPTAASNSSNASYTEAALTQAPAISSPMSPQLQRLTDDALWLERSCAGQSLLEPLVTDPISFRTCPVRRISKQGAFVLQNDISSVSFGPVEVTRCIWLPRRDEARIILHKYVSDVDHFHHIVHIPSALNSMEKVYDDVDSNASMDIGAMSLLLSICASSTYAWSHQDGGRLLYASTTEARSQASSWLKAALDVMDHAQRTAHTSLECIQGMIILFFVFCNIEGLSQRARALHARAIAMARELSLHRIDAPSNSDVRKMTTTAIESSRRVWWFLVATDWMLTQFAFPQEGSFTIHPSHMAVCKPSNVNDEDIIDGQPLIGRPLDEPTSSSSLIYRIRLAELCRTMLDRDRAYALHPEAMDHKSIMEIDAKFRIYLRELPDFFSMDSRRLQNVPPPDPRRNHSIVVQRYTLNLMLHRHLCKLHLPYLARGSVEPAYAYSRDACLIAARMIIETERHLKLEDLPFSATRLRSIIVLRSVFLASIALVLDACLKENTEQTAINESHLVEAWRIMDEAKDHSPIGGKLLELSVQVLRRHSPNHPALAGFTMQPPTMPMTPDSAGREEQKRATGFPSVIPEPDASYLDPQWQALEGRMDLNTIDWDKLFYGLDAPFI